MFAVENEQDFLNPQGYDSDPVIFQLIMDQMRIKIKEALKLSRMLKPEPELSNVEILLRKSAEIMVRQCPTVSQGYNYYSQFQSPKEAFINLMLNL